MFNSTQLIDPVLFLNKSGLHITEPRKEILLAFLRKQTVLTQRDIQELSSRKYSRVTVYRTLDRFVKNNIIHIVPSLDNIIRYALVRDISKEGCFQRHLHFICEACSHTYCLGNLPMPSLVLPVGFLTKEVDVIIKGVCKNCRQHSK